MSLPHSTTWSAVIVVKIDQHDQAVSDIRKLRTTDSTIQATNVSRLAHWNKKSLITRMMSWKGQKGQLLLNGVVFCVSIYLKNSGFYGGKSRTQTTFQTCFRFILRLFCFPDKSKKVEDLRPLKAVVSILNGPFLYILNWISWKYSLIHHGWIVRLRNSLRLPWKRPHWLIVSRSFPERVYIHVLYIICIYKWIETYTHLLQAWRSWKCLSIQQLPSAPCAPCAIA